MLVWSLVGEKTSVSDDEYDPQSFDRAPRSEKLTKRTVRHPESLNRWSILMWCHWLSMIVYEEVKSRDEAISKKRIWIFPLLGLYWIWNSPGPTWWFDWLLHM